MLLVVFIQCTTQESKQNCGEVVTENVSLISDTKSKSGSIPISYNKCEYIIVVPKGQESAEFNAYLKANNAILLKVSEFDPSLRLYTFPPRTDVAPPPVNPPPKPIIIFKNIKVLNEQNQPINQFDFLSQLAAFSPKM